MRQSNPSSGRCNPRRGRQRAAGRRSWARRGRSSMRPRRQCSRGDWAKFGETMEGLKRLAGWAGTVGLHNPGNPYANPGILSGWDLSRPLSREGARRTGPRSVRVCVRQVVGSTQRLGGYSTTCRTSTSCKPEVLASVQRECEEMVERHSADRVVRGASVRNRGYLQDLRGKLPWS